MEGTECSSQRRNLHWMDAMNRLFYDTLRENHADPSKSDLGFKNAEWLKIGEMRVTLNVDVPVLKLKNHFKIWKANAKSLNDIIKQSGFGWNERTRQFEAASDVWDAMLQGNPNARYWKDKAFTTFFEEVTKFLEPDYGTGEETMTFEDYGVPDGGMENHPLGTPGLDEMETNMDSIDQQTLGPMINSEGNSHRRASLHGGRAESTRTPKKRKGTAAKISSPLKEIASVIGQLVSCGNKMSRRGTCEEFTKVVRSILDLDP